MVTDPPTLNHLLSENSHVLVLARFCSSQVLRESNGRVVRIPALYLRDYMFEPRRVDHVVSFSGFH
jgi:hypothetical protein